MGSSKKYMNKVFKIHPLAEKPPSMDFHQIWHSHRVIDLITCDKYFGDRLRGVDYVAVIFCHFLLISPTQPVISDLSGGKFFFQNRACVYISCWFAVFHIHRNCTFRLSLHNSAPSQHATCTILKLHFNVHICVTVVVCCKANLYWCIYHCKCKASL